MNQSLLRLSEIQNIENESKGSFYFLDLDRIENNFHDLWNVFRSFYPNTQLAYSFKTNYTPKICQLIKSLGGWAEVVSEMEYIMAIQIGFSPKNIIINGPLHRSEFIERSLLDGAQVNLDSWYLLDAVTAISKKYPNQTFEIGIRLTFPIAEGGFSRFGIEATTANMKKLKDWENGLKNCKIIGFHSHFSNSSRSLESFSSRMDQMITHSKNYFENSTPHFINAGGGLLGKMPKSLALQFDGNTPDYYEYAAVIAGRMNKAYPSENMPVLFLEPGTAVVADAMDFICKVHEVKYIDHIWYAVVDGSNHNINHKWGNEELPIEIYHSRAPSDATITNFSIVGNTCIEKDVMRKQVTGTISIGDYIVFQYAGAYTNVLKQPFIHPCQPIYSRYKSNISVAKRSEEVQDVLATYFTKKSNLLPDNYCIVTITCDDFCAGTEVLLYSFLQHNPWFQGAINIVIAELSEACRERLRSIYPVQFVQASNQLITKIDILKTHYKHLKDIHLRFYSLEAFNMTGYDKVIYLDSDMYCSGDMKDLFLNEAPLSACLDGFSYEEKAKPIVEQAGFKLSTSAKRYGKHFKNSFNAGVISISSSILSKKNFEGLIAMLDYDTWSSFGNTIFTDQMIINRYFENQIATISGKYNYTIFLDDYIKYVDNISYDDIRIVHFAGKIKPWNNYRKEEILIKAPHYLKYIDIWRSLLMDVRNKKNPKYQATQIIKQYEWTESGADSTLEVLDRIY